MDDMRQFLRTDTELVEASRRGERAAFGQLVERYQDVVCAVSYSSTGSWSLSEDVAQDTFIAAWRQLGQLRETAQVRSWLCTIARNLARKARRRSDREEIVEEEPAAAGATPFDATARAEVDRIVRDALARVPATYREALVLYYREQESVREVAATLGISEAAALQRLARGRKYLADGVTKLVEDGLRSTRPRRSVVAGVLAAIAGFVAPSRVDASPIRKGSTMLKAAIAVVALSAAGTTAYVIHDRAAAPEQAAAQAPIASAPRVAEPQARPAQRAVTPPSLATKSAAAAIGREPQPETIIPAEKIEKLKIYSGPSRGPANAKVTIAIYQDNICPYCGHVLGTLDQLMDEYPNKLRLVVKQFPVHKQAVLAAEASYAADAQGKFWEMHDVIFQHQDNLSREALIEYAKQIGLDVAAFTSALDGHTYDAVVKEDMAAGRDIGIDATPSFVINGHLIVGALPIESYRAVVNAALAE